MTQSFNLKPMIAAGNMSGNLTSSVVRFDGAQVSLCVAFKYESLAGTQDGVFAIQVANVPEPASGDWVTKQSYTLQGGDPTAATKHLTVDLVHETHMRVVFTKNGVSGGTLNAYATAKKKIG